MLPGIISQIRRPLLVPPFVPLDGYSYLTPTGKSSGFSLSNFNLTATLDGSPPDYYNQASGATALAGKTYWEATLTPLTTNSFGDNFGVGLDNRIGESLTAPAGNNYWVGGKNNGGNASGVGIWEDNSIDYNGAVSVSGSGSNTNPVTFKVAHDAATGNTWLGTVEHGWIGGGNPAAGTSPTKTLSIGAGYGPYYPRITCSAPWQVVTVNFGAAAFLGTVPSGFAGVLA